MGSFRSAFLGVSNWYFVHSSVSSFGADVTRNPVVQFWSLSAAVQLFLIWPLALAGGFFLTRRMDPDRRMRVVAGVVIVGALASAAGALALRHSHPDHAFFGTDARAYEFLAGALIALVPALVNVASRIRRAARVVALASFVAVVVIATSWVHLDVIERDVAITLVTLVLLVSLEAAEGGIARRALSTRPIVYLGRISYGTYLWHWIVILVMLQRFQISTTATVGLGCLIATALAALSFELLERPVRRSRHLDRHRLVVIATGVAVSLISAIVWIPKIVDPAHAEAPVLSGASIAGFKRIPSDLDWRQAKEGGGPFIECLGRSATACTVVRGTGAHILLLGDSHAWMLIPAFEAIARRENLTLSISVRGGCPWQQDLYVFPITVNGTELRTADCQAQKDDTYSRVIPALHPDLIVVMEVAHEDKRLTPFLGPYRKVMKNGSPTFFRWIEGTTKRSLDVLRADGRKVLIIEPIPVDPADPLTCLSRAKVFEQCTYVVNPNPDPIEHYYRQLAERDGRVWSADIDRLVCPYLPLCDPVVNGQIVKSDATHLTTKFAKSLAPSIDAYLRNNGLIPG